MAALEARISDGPFGTGNKAIRFGEVCHLDLKHQEVDIWRNHSHVFWEDDAGAIGEG